MLESAPVLEHDTVAVSALPTELQGSPPKAVVVAATEHDCLPTHADTTVDMEFVEWQELEMTYPPAHDPVGVPKLVKRTDVITLPEPNAPHVSVNVAPSVT